MSKPSTFSKRLRELLDINGITQSELARKSGISKSSISRYLKGDWEAKQDAVYSIAKTTNVNEAWLMGYDVPMERHDAAIPINSEIIPTPVSESGHPVNVIKIAGRDGSYIEKRVSDEQLALFQSMLDQMKPVDDESI